MTKYVVFSIFLFVFSTNFIFVQTHQLKTPPRQENTYLFEVLDYNRQPELPQYMKIGIEEMVEKPMSKWNAKDSLFYAYENVHLQKFGLAFNIFSRLNTDSLTEPHAQILYRITLQQKKRFQLLEKFNQKTLPETQPDEVYSLKAAFSDLTKAFQAYENKTFSEDTSRIFSILNNKKKLDSYPRNEPPNKNKLVSISFVIDSVLRQATILNNKQDFILSKAFEEMGDFQSSYLYLTNAYFYYSGSLHYNKNNQSVFKSYNHTINEMTRNNFISLSFNTKFGRVIKNRYKLREDYTTEENKSNWSNQNNQLPQETEKRKDFLPWLETPVLILIILSFMLLFVLIFIKVEKN